MCEVRDHRNMQKWIQQFIVLAIPIATLSLCLFFLTRQRHPLVWCVCMFVCGFVCEFGCRYVAREWPYWKKVILKQTETNWTTWIKKREKYYRISRKSREKCFGRERQHLACIVRTNKLSVCQQHTYYRRLMCVWFSVDLQMKKNIQFENCCRCTREKRIESQCSICFFFCCKVVIEIKIVCAASIRWFINVSNLQWLRKHFRDEKRVSCKSSHIFNILIEIKF